MEHYLRQNKGVLWRRLAGLFVLLGMVAIPTVALAGDTVGSRLIDFVTFRYDFMTWTVSGSLLVGLTCGVLGTFLLLRRMSLMGDALGHAALPGVGIAFWLVQAKVLLAMVAGAATTGLMAALSVGYITRHSKTKPDAALGIVLTGFFGLGTVLFSYLQNSPSAAQSGLDDFLFGNASALQGADVALLGGIAAVVLGAIALFYKPLLLSTFDPELAKGMGLPTRTIHYGLMTATALAVVASMQAVGAILVAAMVITPAATAHLLAKRFHHMLFVAGGVGALSGVAGSALSFVYDGFSSGPSMVLVAASFYLAAVLFAPEKGLVTKMWNKWGAKDAGTPVAPARPHAESLRDAL